jgi:Tol biopolymer transport system component
MPDVQEVFRLATNKVQPDPDALERQVRRQRAEVRKSRVRAYIAVAAVLVVLAITAYAISRAVEKNDVSPEGGSNTSTAPSSVGPLTFVGELAAAATPQSPAVVDISGQRSALVSGVPLDGFAPSVTSDGSQIAMVASPNELGYNQIVIMNADGSGARFVRTTDIDVGSVAISPDGTRIAFEGTVDGNTDIYVVNSDETGLRRLTTDPNTDQYPAWSPDGTTIAYDNAGGREQIADPQFSKTAEIYTVPADGGPVTRITHNDGSDAAPSYSPDGTTIVDQSFHGFSTMNPDGSNYRGFPVASSTAFTPRYSPNGKTIAFTYYKDVLVRPTVQFGYRYGQKPMVILALVDVASGDVTKLRNVGIASDLNTPQWLDDQHLFVLRVPANGA